MPDFIKTLPTVATSALFLEESFLRPEWDGTIALCKPDAASTRREFTAIAINPSRISYLKIDPIVLTIIGSTSV